jgi:hypothetical protein
MEQSNLLEQAKQKSKGKNKTMTNMTSLSRGLERSDAAVFQAVSQAGISFVLFNMLSPMKCIYCKTLIQTTKQPLVELQGKRT